MATIRDALNDLSAKKLNDLITLNVEEPAIKKFVDMLHHGINRRVKSLAENPDVDYVYESRLFLMICSDRHLSANRCVEKLNEKYGYVKTEEEVIRVFRFNGITTLEKREELFSWASTAVDAFVKALISKSGQDCEAYLKMRPNYEYRSVKHKVFCLMLYTKHPEIDVYNDLENLEKFGIVYAKYLHLDMHDFLKNVCGAQSKGKDKNKSAAQKTIERFENALQRNEMMLKDLQDDFEARLAENHQNEMTEFFSRLNSERYGCILDSIMNVRNGRQQLRRQNVELPPEISGIFILIDNLIKFVRDNEINPIMKLGSIHTLKAGDIENYSGDYEGTPYANSEEAKQVKVISPGWYYKNKDIQISRPRLKELDDEAAE